MSERRTSTRRQMLQTAGAVAVGALATGAAGATRAIAAEKQAPRWAMVVDLRRCTGVRACTVACKAEYDVPLGSFRTVVKQITQGDYPNLTKDFIPRLCNHCDGNPKDEIPPCVKICPENASGERKKFITQDGKKIRYRTGATYKRPDGMILFDNSLCIGCGKCIDECPYGARSYNKRLISGKDPQKNGIVKCTFCQHRVDNGVQPACVSGCPNNARIFGDLNDPDSDVSQLAKQFKLLDNRDTSTMLPDEGTIPQVFYIDPNSSLGAMKITKKNKLDEFRDVIA